MHHVQEVVGNSVQTRRKEKGVTQEELAEVIGISRQTVISIEKGNYVPSVLLAMKIAAYFDVSVEEVFYIE